MAVHKYTLIRDFILYFIIAVLAAFLMFKFLPNQFVVSGNDEPVTRISDSSELTVLFFHKEGCPHCEVARPVLKKIQEKYPEVDWVVFNLSFATKDMMTAYHSWLKAAGKKEQATPVIVVGPKSDLPWVTLGFLDERTDRAPIENEIRKRLALEVIEFDSTSFHIPFKGYTVLSELGSQARSFNLGFFSAVFPLSFFFLFLLSFSELGNSKNLIISISGILIVSFLVRVFPATPVIPSTVLFLLRILAGGVVLLVVSGLAYQFVVDGRMAVPSFFVVNRTLRLTIFGVCLLVDWLATLWIQAMAQIVGVESWPAYIGAFLIPATILLGTCLLTGILCRRSHPRANLLWVIWLLAALYWSLLLLTGHNFSGYGLWLWV